MNDGAYASFEQAIFAEDAGRAVPELCRLALTEILQGGRPVAAIRHPLGFICLPVQRDGEYGVCVHVWTPLIQSVQVTTATVHSHSWDLVSFVLYGSVGNTVTRVVDDPVGGTHRVYEIHSRGDVDEIRATPRLVRCVEEANRAAGPGEAYRLHAGQFHASFLDGGSDAATVVLGRTRSAMDLALGPPDVVEQRIPRQRCGVEETGRAARMVIDKLLGATDAGRVR